MVCLPADDRRHLRHTLQSTPRPAHWADFTEVTDTQAPSSEAHQSGSWLSPSAVQSHAPLTALTVAYGLVQVMSGLHETPAQYNIASQQGLSLIEL